VEVGGQYTDPASSQVLMRLDDFIDTHFATGSANDASGYMAQHRIVDQVRSLRTAYTVPDYCACAIADDGSSDVVTMGWLGPLGTISPCHHDPYHNLLAQVVGHKHVILFPPHAHMYPRDDFMTNTSRIDLSVGPVDPVAYPLFSWEHATAATLAPGDVLFIPRHWWHFIVSVPPPPTATAAAVSGALAHCESGSSHVFSLSFWFGERILKGVNGNGNGNGESS
jgi:lysine-specific demethylase 8